MFSNHWIMQVITLDNNHRNNNHNSSSNNNSSTAIWHPSTEPALETHGQVVSTI